MPNIPVRHQNKPFPEEKWIDMAQPSSWIFCLLNSLKRMT